MQQQAQAQSQRSRPGVPPFKPLPPGASRPLAQQPERQRLIVQQNSTQAQALRPIQGPTFGALQDDALKQHQRAQMEGKLREQQHIQQEMIAMQMLKQQRQQQQEAMKRIQQQQAQQVLQMQKVQYPQQALQAAYLTKRMQVTMTEDMCREEYRGLEIEFGFFAVWILWYIYGEACVICKIQSR